MVRFHVVNSVKGGCGKSTFSLYLANYLTAQEHRVVIIGLDIGGSTWYRDFSPYLVNETEKSGENGKDVDYSIEETKFLNDLFYEYEKNKTKKHIFKLKITDAVIKQVPNTDNQDSEDHDKQINESKNQAAGVKVKKTGNENQTDEEEKTKYEIIEGEKRTLNVIMNDPKRASCIRDEELDLLEETICSLVDEIATNTYPPDSEKILDFVFDMPPGYEEHSEHILMHALMDFGSNLYEKYTGKKDEDGKYTNPVYLYMISCVKRSALDANIQYVERLFHSPSYSMDVDVLNAKNIFFILNDADALFSQFIEMDKLSPQNEGKTLTKTVKETYKINQTRIQVYFIRHIFIQTAKLTYNDYINPKAGKPSSHYQLIEETDGFKDSLNEMKHLAVVKRKDSHARKS